LRTRRTATIVLLPLAFAALLCLMASAVLADPGATAAKHKKHKKKKFVPKFGLYTSKDGKTRLRVLAFGGNKAVRLFGAPPTAVACNDGTSRQVGIAGLGVTAPLKKKSFSLSNPNTVASFKGSFTSTKALKGTYTLHAFGGRQGVLCTAAPIAFTAKYVSN
jgi:hypothetical protein